MGGNIFISYRRGDDPGNTGRLFDRLQEVFAPDQLFMDVDSIAPGLDFLRVLEEQVAKCDVLLAVIGKGWIDARDPRGARRLDSPEDFVRIEIESALNHGKRVIPILVGGARMPQAAELPEPIKPLARRNAVRLTHERFRADTQGLVKALQQALHEIEARHRSQREALRTAQVEEERRKGHENAIEVAKTGLVAEEGARRAPQKPERRPVTESISTGNLVFYVGAPILVGLIVIFVWIFSPPSLQPPPSVESRQLPEQARAPEQPPATAPPLFPAQPSDSSKPGTEHPPAAYEQPRRTGTLTSEPVQERLIPIEQPPPQAEVPRTGTLEPHIPAITTPTLHTSPTQIKGGWRIHAGAFASEDEARERLVLVRNSFEGSFPSAEFYTQKVIKGDKSLYRALAGGFTRDSAERACRLLKRKDIACIALKE